MTTRTEHLFIPQYQIADVVNDRVLGLYSTSELQSYYQPSKLGIAFSERLIHRLLVDSDVEIVVGTLDEGLPDDADVDSKRNKGMLFVIGPEDLRTQLHDLPGAKNFLHDHGPVHEALLREGITEE